MKADHDSSQLTAYVLGELDDQQRAKVEQRLAQDKQARIELQQTREVASLLTECLKNEPCPSLSIEQRYRIQVSRDKPRSRWSLRFPSFWWGQLPVYATCLILLLLVTVMVLRGIGTSANNKLSQVNSNLQ